jgi:hypothetical protein
LVNNTKSLNPPSSVKRPFHGVWSVFDEVKESTLALFAAGGRPALHPLSAKIWYCFAAKAVI